MYEGVLKAPENYLKNAPENLAQQLFWGHFLLKKINF